MCQNLIGGRIQRGPNEAFQWVQTTLLEEGDGSCLSHSWEICIFRFYLELNQVDLNQQYTTVCVCARVHAHARVHMWMCVSSFSFLQDILWVLRKCHTSIARQPFLVELREPKMNLLTLLCPCKSWVQSHLTVFKHFNKSKVTLQAKGMQRKKKKTKFKKKM